MNKVVGVFDSGLGGLTAVKELMQCLPGEDIVYFGDTGRVPYGTRSRETVIKYAQQDIRFLSTFPIKAVLAACGTVSALALDDIKNMFPVPILGVVEGSAAAAAKAAKNGRIGVIGTPGSIASGAYERAISRIDGGLHVKSVACPLFVPLVENGRVHLGDPVIETIAKEYLERFIEYKPDVLILGCTHYPLLKEVIASIMGDEVVLIDPGATAAHAMKEMLQGMNQLNEKQHGGKQQFFVSDNIYNFSTQASFFLQRPMEALVEKIEIEKY